jgi:Complex1_LYR-like
MFQTYFFTIVITTAPLALQTAMASSGAASTASTRHAALSLYRNILRAHQKHLSGPRPEMKELGDAYIKSEFRLHKTANAQQATMFLREWDGYLQQLCMTARAREATMPFVGSMDITSSSNNNNNNNHNHSVFEFGAELPHNVTLSREQQQQLQKLKEEASKLVGKRK